MVSYPFGEKLTASTDLRWPSRNMIQRPVLRSHNLPNASIPLKRQWAKTYISQVSEIYACITYTTVYLRETLHRYWHKTSSFLKKIEFYVRLPHRDKNKEILKTFNRLSNVSLTPSNCFLHLRINLLSTNTTMKVDTIECQHNLLFIWTIPLKYWRRMMALILRWFVAGRHRFGTKLMHLSTLW